MAGQAVTSGQPIPPAMYLHGADLTRYDQVMAMVRQLQGMQKRGWSISEQAGLYDALGRLVEVAAEWRGEMVRTWEGE